jgi:hypothetical protein
MPPAASTSAAIRPAGPPPTMVTRRGAGRAERWVGMGWAVYARSVTRGPGWPSRPPRNGRYRQRKPAGLGTAMTPCVFLLSDHSTPDGLEGCLAGCWSPTALAQVWS